MRTVLYILSETVIVGSQLPTGKRKSFYGLADGDTMNIGADVIKVRKYDGVSVIGHKIKSGEASQLLIPVIRQTGHLSLSFYCSSHGTKNCETLPIPGISCPEYRTL